MAGDLVPKLSKEDVDLLAVDQNLVDAGRRVVDTRLRAGWGELFFLPERQEECGGEGYERVDCREEGPDVEKEAAGTPAGEPPGGWVRIHLQHHCWQPDVAQELVINIVQSLYV